MRSVATSGLCMAVALALTATRPAPALAEKPLLLGVHPFLPATELVQKFSPLADYLARRIGRPVHVKISRDYKSHVKSVGRGAYDIAYMGPVSYVRLVETYGEVPLLGRLEINGHPTFQGVIFVREDSPVRRLEELAGKRVAYVTRSSTMGFIVPRFVLRRAGVADDELGGHSFLNNHDNVVLAVLVGDFDAGAAKEETFDKFVPQGARALAVTPPISEHLFVSSPGRPGELIEGLRTTLRHIAAEPEGLKALRAIKATATNLVPVENRDYDILRKILEDSDRGAAVP